MEPAPPAPLRRPFILAGCMAAMFMAAVEATIVATAMPTIIARLGGFSLLGWVFAAYLLTQAVTAPIYGRLSDLYGRRRAFFAGAGLFLLGSTLCGLAPSMPALVGFRALQGLGAGAILSLAQTIVGDIYAPAERARVQGWLSSVWGVSAIAGPLLGAFIVRHLGWPVVFWVNLPIGAAAVALFALFLPERRSGGARLDLAGALLLVLAAGSLMLALLQAAELGTGGVLGLLALAAVAGALLLRHERRAPSPILPLALWHDRVILGGNVGALAIGAVMMGVSAFLPTYVQGVMGRGALAGGVALALMSLGWSVSSTLSGRMMLATSYRATAAAGGAMLLASSLLLFSLAPGSATAFAALASLVVGGGMGLSNTTFLVSVQNVAAREVRGIATASTVFMRMLGASLGTALLGAVLNLGLRARAGDVADPVQALMDPAQRGALTAAEAARLTEAVAGAMAGVFLAAAALAVAALALAWMLPPGFRPVEAAERAAETA